MPVNIVIALPLLCTGLVFIFLHLSNTERRLLIPGLSLIMAAAINLVVAVSPGM